MRQVVAFVLIAILVTLVVVVWSVWAYTNPQFPAYAPVNGSPFAPASPQTPASPQPPVTSPADEAALLARAYGVSNPKSVSYAVSSPHIDVNKLTLVPACPSKYVTQCPTFGCCVEPESAAAVCTANAKCFGYIVDPEGEGMASLLSAAPGPFAPDGNTVQYYEKQVKMPGH